VVTECKIASAYQLSAIRRSSSASMRSFERPVASFVTHKGCMADKLDRNSLQTAGHAGFPCFFEGRTSYRCHQINAAGLDDYSFKSFCKGIGGGAFSELKENLRALLGRHASALFSVAFSAFSKESNLRTTCSTRVV
jgi:hypothetical protein